jgi:hypothetical protein
MTKPAKKTTKKTKASKPAAAGSEATGKPGVAQLCADNGLSSYWHKPVSDRL